jgi:FKBP-type peptidyl-prolyl cis-trans isomerase FkpA
MRFLSVISKAMVLISMMSISSCSGSQNRNQDNQSNEIPLETYIKINRSLVANEQVKIKAYLDSQNIEMDVTGTGLWYVIDAQGNGDQIKRGQIVTIDYQVKLLDGTICYDSDKSGPQEFEVGRGGVESGLEEGILMLKEGSKARFIMPPHLAHGLIGDDDEIPARAIIQYQVEVLDVKK